jgi:hypothetical protein
MSTPFSNPYPERYFNSNEFVCRIATEDDKNNEYIKKNCDYFNRYPDFNRNEGMFRDSENLYTRGWFQTINLLIGTLFLGIQIYRETQKK